MSVGESNWGRAGEREIGVSRIVKGSSGIPPGSREDYRPVPGVSAALRPPATFFHPSGICPRPATPLSATSPSYPNRIEERKDFVRVQRRPSLRLRESVQRLSSRGTAH